VTQTNPSTTKANTNLKLIESSDNSSIIISSPDKLIRRDEVKQNKDTLKIPNISINNFNGPKHRSPRAVSYKERTFTLYPNGVSDWDSTDSETGINETNGNYGELETCHTRL
jgi:hypothetical protein